MSQKEVLILPPSGGGRGQIMGTALAALAILAVLNYGPLDLFGGRTQKAEIEERVNLEEKIVQKTEAEGKALAAHARCDEKLKSCEEWRVRLLGEVEELKRINEKNYTTIKTLADALELKIDPFSAHRRAARSAELRTSVRQPAERGAPWWKFWSGRGGGRSPEVSGGQSLDGRAAAIESRLSELERRSEHLARISDEDKEDKKKE